MSAANAQPTVLIVDDHPPMHRVFARLLAREGVQVLAAADGPAALAAANATHPAVILLDLHLEGGGGMDGLDTLRALRAAGETANVVIVSGSASLSAAREAMNLGAFDYVTKPFDADFIRGVVHRALAR